MFKKFDVKFSLKLILSAFIITLILGTSLFGSLFGIYILIAFAPFTISFVIAIILILHAIFYSETKFLAIIFGCAFFLMSLIAYLVLFPSGSYIVKFPEAELNLKEGYGYGGLRSVEFAKDKNLAMISIYNSHGKNNAVYILNFDTLNSERLPDSYNKAFWSYFYESLASINNMDPTFMKYLYIGKKVIEEVEQGFRQKCYSKNKDGPYVCQTISENLTSYKLTTEGNIYIYSIDTKQSKLVNENHHKIIYPLILDNFNLSSR